MLATNSPEFSYENNMLFESPTGQMMVAKTYANGQKHLWEVNEVTGKQTHTSHEAMLVQQAQVLVNAHTHYSLGSPETGSYGQMDWDGALNEIFGPAKTEVETESVQQDEFVLTPYMLEMQASTNPASIDHVIAGYTPLEATPKHVTSTVVIAGLPERITQTQTSAVEQKEPVDDSPNVAHSALTADPTIPLALGMVVLGKLGKTKSGEWLTNKGAGFAKWQSEYRASYRGNTQAERRKFRNMRIAGVALMGIGAVLFLAIGNSCDDDKDTVPSPSVTATSTASPSPSTAPSPTTAPSPSTSPSPSSPGTAGQEQPDTDDNGSGKDSHGEKDFEDKTEIKSFVVQKGNGITHELKELGQEQQVAVSPAEAFQQYLYLEAYSKKTDTPFFSGKNSGTYTMSDGHYGISNAGLHQWNQDMLKQAQKWLDDYEDELSD